MARWQWSHDLENLEADLVVESEWVDPENSRVCCKRALSSEMIADSGILADADCSTSTDELDDPKSHKPDNSSFSVFAFLTFLVSLILIPILILIPWPSSPLTFPLWLGLALPF